MWNGRESLETQKKVKVWELSHHPMKAYKLLYVVKNRETIIQLKSLVHPHPQIIKGSPSQKKYNFFIPPKKV